jgi:hypothetical protein
MRVVSLRFLVGSLVLVLAAAGPLAAEETTLLGTWTLDLKASQNVPEAQKGVDLKIGFRGNELTTTRLVGDRPVGQPMVLTLDGVKRPLDVGGQRGTVVARWVTRGTKFEQVVSMPQPGSVFVATQTITSEVSPSGGTMTRTYVIRLATDSEDRLLVYRRK